MSSPDSGSGWSIISIHREEQEAAIQKQAERLERSSAANLSGRRLGTSRTNVQMENSLPPPPPLIVNAQVASPGPVPIPNARRDSRRHGTKEFPSVDPSDERPEQREEPPKGNSFVRRVRSSLLGGKNPFASQNKTSEKDKQEPIVIPPPLSPEPDVVIVGRPGSESNGTTPEPPVVTKTSRGPRPPVSAYSSGLYSGRSAQPTQSHRPRGGSFSSPTHSQPTASEPVKTERPPSRNRSRGSKEISITLVSSKKIEEVSVIEREPVLGALQSHRVVSGKATHAPLASAPAQQSIRPLPAPPTVQPTVTLVPPPQPVAVPPPPPAQRPNPALNPGPNPVVATPVPQPTRPPPESLHPGAHYADGHHHQIVQQTQQLQHTQQTVSSPPVVRYKTSSDRTSYTTTATTPSLSSSQATSDAPPKGMERTHWASAPPTRPPVSGHTRAATVGPSSASEDWTSSLQQLSLRAGQQQGYHMEMSSKYENPPNGSPPSTHPQPPPKSKPNKLQRHATTGVSAPSTVVTHYYYDPSPPLITRISRLSQLKDDYRDPGDRSAIIRRKINYLRFELGYTGLRRARGDGNCFYRSFAFCYLEQILFAEDRAVAVVSALEHLEIAQNLVEAAQSSIENSKKLKFSRQMHLFMRDLIRNIELGKTDQKRLLRTFQDLRDSDDIVAYVRLLASAYILLTPELHASVFHPDEPGIVISPLDFCVYFVEEMNQDADHLQISALSRTLNVAVHIYRLDEKFVDGTAPHEQDLPAHCTRFTPTGKEDQLFMCICANVLLVEAPAVTEPVALLFRPGHYDILERHTEDP